MRSGFSWLDVKLGIRMLFKNPALSLVGGLGMAVAIAIGAGTFSAFQLFVYPRLPLDEGHRIVALENWNVRLDEEELRSVHDFAAWKQEMKTVRDVSAYRDVQRNLIAADGTIEPLVLAEISASAFRVARVAPLLGRPLLDEDERPGAPPVVVLGHDLWRTRFGGDPRVVGRPVRLGHTVHTVVGVMPRGFAFPVYHGAWIPLRISPLDHPRGEGPELMVFGRLADGATREQARAELDALGRRAAAEFPRTHADLRPRVLPYTYPVTGTRDVSLWELALAQSMNSLLLVVVAVNVAILVYARTATRRGEIAVRAALGASRRRIVGQLFMEAFVLAAAASVVGLLLAWVGLETAIRILVWNDAGGAPFWMKAAIPPATVLYATGMAVMAAVIAGVLPALGATGRRMQDSLRQLGGGSGLQLGRTWTVLIVSQVAFAVAAIPITLGAAANELGGAVNRPRFEADRYLAATLTADPGPPPGMDAETYRREGPARFANLQGEVVRRLREEPWAQGAAVATSLPGQGTYKRIQLDSEAGSSKGHWVLTSHVAPDYLDLYGVPVLAGRALAPGDADTAAAAILVNQAFARKYLDGGGVGRRVRYAPPQKPGVPPAPERWYEVVGVVGDAHSNAVDPDHVLPALFHPLVPAQFGTASVSVRVRGGSAGDYQAHVRRVVAAVDPTLRLEMRLLADVYADGQASLRLTFVVLVVIIVSVLLLCAAGIYALMSFTVSQRRREIGIRAALGADPRHLLGSLFSRSARQLGMGAAVGVAAACALNWTMGGQALYGRGAVLLPGVCLLMLATGLLATLGPARRGLRIQPMDALREE
jgi:putative ABC transport system permease protein